MSGRIIRLLISRSNLQAMQARVDVAVRAFLVLIRSRLHDRWGDPPHVTSPIWGPRPPCKRALKVILVVSCP